MSGECDKCGEHCLECSCNSEPTQWISVKERLPEHGQQILVYETFPEGTMFMAVAKPLITCSHDICEYGAYGNGFVNNMSNTLKYVSHWMPLPKPPEQ